MDALGSIVHCSTDNTVQQGEKKKKLVPPTITKHWDAPSMSNRSSLLINHSAAAFALCGSVRSIGSQTSSPGCSPIPSCSIREIAFSAFSSLLAARYTFAPRLTRWSAMYRPIPELYPKRGSWLTTAGAKAAQKWSAGLGGDALCTGNNSHTTVQVKQVSLWEDI